ncbi:MAG: tetratricopeptide repeat protein [Chloroflexota bacterium]|nr:tetratricopeptide repeat protein [Chloroflexota bacterium]
MADQDPRPFIDRETELARIEELIEDWSTRRVLCIHAEGGYGKTFLLQEVHRRYSEAEGERLLVTMLDFDDPDLRVPENIGRRLAMLLGEDTFRPYLRRLMDWHRMKAADVSPERLKTEGDSIRQGLAQSLSAAAKQRRIVLLVDTTDAVERSDVWTYLFDLLYGMENTLAILSGRNAGDLWEILSRRLGDDALEMNLSALKEKASAEFLRAKEEQLHITVGKVLAEKLLLLAQGRPIMINLVVEWAAHGIDLAWLQEESIEELEKLSSDELQDRQAELEFHLVEHIGDLRTPMDRLALTLAHVYPLDAEMIGELLRIGQEEAWALMDEARACVYVKPLPDGRVNLHDEVRRWVQRLWEMIDPTMARRREYSGRALSYFEGRTEALEASVTCLEVDMAAAQKQGDTEREFELLVKQEAAERELQVIERRKLRHLLLVDLNEGVDTFMSLFDAATLAYQFAAREELISEVTKYADRLTTEQRYGVDIRQAKNLLDHGKYETGRNLLLDMLDGPGLEPSQQVDMHIQLGNLEIRLGDFGAGLDHFEKAVELSREHNIEDWLTRALNALGWGHRLIGHFEIAIQHYKEALELSMRLQDRKREAWILNNMAFAIAHLGRHKTALNLCDQALDLWRDVDFDRGLGAVHEVYGEVYVLSERFDEALSHYRAALDIFEPSEDREWLSRVYAGCGLAYRLIGDLDSAEAILNKALGIGLGKDKALILHRLAHIYEERGEIDEAEQYFLDSYDSCDTASEADLQLNNLSDLAEIALHKEQYNRLEEFAARFGEYEREWPNVNFPRAEGTLFKSLGDLALCANPDDVDSAWGYYERAFPLLAGRDDLMPYTAQAQLNKLNNLLTARQIPEHTIEELGRRLRELWRREGLDSRQPDALRFFLRWMEGEYYA